MLTLLPDDLLSTLVSEWIDPEDLPQLVKQGGMLDRRTFWLLAAQGGVRIRATKVLSRSCLNWLAAFDVPVARWKTEERIEGPSGKIRCEWRCNGQLHRDGDQPAVDVLFNGKRTQIWYQHGELHREGDQPAWVRSNGDQAWWQKGRRHREGGLPAIVRYSGRVQGWYEHGRLVR